LNKLQETAFKDIKKMLSKNPIKTNLTDEQVDEIIQKTLLNKWNNAWSRNESKLLIKSLAKILK